MSIYIDPVNTTCSIPLEEFARLVSEITDNPTVVVNCAFEAFELKDGVAYAHIRPASLEWIDPLDGDKNYFANIENGGLSLAIEVKDLDTWIAT